MSGVINRKISNENIIWRSGESTLAGADEMCVTLIAN